MQDGIRPTNVRVHREGDARQRMQVSERQLKRIVSRYRREGDAGLVHRSRGKRSRRALSADFKEND